MIHHKVVAKLRRGWSCFRAQRLHLWWGRRFALARNWLVQLGSGLRLELGGTGSVAFHGSAILRDYITLRASGGRIEIGAGSFINSYSSLNARDRIVIGRDCLIGEGVRIYDHDHLIDPAAGTQHQQFKLAPVIIGDGVWIGSGTIILRGSRIGDHAVIGAASLIKGEVPARAIVYRRRDEDSGQRLVPPGPASHPA